MGFRAVNVFRLACLVVVDSLVELFRVDTKIAGYMYGFILGFFWHRRGILYGGMTAWVGTEGHVFGESMTELFGILFAVSRFCDQVTTIISLGKAGLCYFLSTVHHLRRLVKDEDDGRLNGCLESIVSAS